MPRLVAIHLAPAKEQPIKTVERVKAIENTGLLGDHHAVANNPRQVLVADLEALRSEGLEPGQLRENLTVEGLNVQGLPNGARIRIADALFEIGGPCGPCDFLDSIRPGLQERMKDKRGRFARVVRGGTLRPGDRVLVVSPERKPLPPKSKERL